MSSSRNCTLLNRVLIAAKKKSPSTQLVIGTSAGLISSYVTAGIEKSAAFCFGAIILFFEIFTEEEWPFNINHSIMDEHIRLIQNFVQNNRTIAIGFIGGYLIGYSFL